LEDQVSLMTQRNLERWDLFGIIGQSRTLRTILEDIRRLQQASTSVLISGESGTGKELIARAIHAGNGRSREPFIPVNCAAIPENLAESLLFGHRRGAFSGAVQDQSGYFALADGGTLFLDEISEMPLPIQAKLLRVLESGNVLPLGAREESAPPHSDARCHGATVLLCVSRERSRTQEPDGRGVIDVYRIRYSSGTSPDRDSDHSP
jgi:transcriptional regulator with GAF, ATPase, and Fis domain